MKKMTKELFAEMFVEDIPDILKDGKEHTLFFDAATLNDDPQLNYLRKAVAEAGYSLTPTGDSEKVKFQNWILSK